MTCLRARLLGGFELYDSNGEELKLSTRKTRALLGFLIVEADRWHTRERLAGLLWSDRQQAQARHSLTQALSTIRKLGEATGEQLIESDSERVRLAAQAVEADVLSFREAKSGSPCQAAAYYAGPLLDGFVAPDDVFDEWLRAERASYHGAACSALNSFAEQAEAGNDQPAAISAIERLVGMDPLDETAHRRLIRLYAQKGDRSESIRQYERCERLLRDELGVEPSPETTALLEAVRTNHASITRQPIVPAPAVEVAQDISPTTGLHRPSIAVLPFENLSGDPEQEVFADGMADDLITALSRFRSLTVIPRSSTFSYKGQSADVQRIADELAAGYVLEGSIRRSGNRIRISAQLIDAHSGTHSWTDRFDRKVDDIFVVQDEVTDGIISAIAPEIDKAERTRAQRNTPGNLNAWTLYQQGLIAYHATTKDGIEKAIELFDQATEADSDFALAFAFAADARLRKMLHYSGVQDQLLDEAAERSRTAIALDNRDPNCLLINARVLSLRGFHETAIALARDAVSLNPTSPMCRYALGFVLDRAGETDEALSHIESAVRSGPRDIFLPGYLAIGALIYFNAERYEEALAWARRASSSPNPRSISFHLVVAALVNLGRRDDANKALSDLLANAERGKTLDSFSEVLSCVWPAASQRNQRLVDALRKAGLPEANQSLKPPDRPSIAVLPFDNLTKDPEQEILSDGIADDIINGLSKFRSLFVIARRSTFTYKDQNKDISNIANELGVRYVVEGSVRRSGERIRVTAQLIDTENGRLIWSDRFDRTLEDVFTVQDEVSEAILQEIAPEISHAEIARAKRTPPGSLNAWSIYQRGLSLHPSGVAEDFDAAIELFDQAHAIDPNFADALAMAAYMRLRKIFFFGDSKGELTLDEARELLTRSMRIDASNSIAHFAMGRLHILCDEPGLADQACRKAIELNPNSVLAHVEMAAALAAQARYEESLREWDAVESLSPTDPHMAAIHAGRAMNLFRLERFEESVEQARASSNSANPRYWADACLVAALIMLDRPQEAEAAKQVLLRRKPDFTLVTLKHTRSMDARPMADALRRAGIPDAPQSRRPPDRPSIAVLPFANLSRDPDQDYFAEGITEDIAGALSNVRTFSILTRNATSAFKGNLRDVREIGRLLKVDYVVEGSVRRAGDRVRVSAQLVDTKSGEQLWANHFDGVLDNIFELQDQVTGAIVGTIEPELIRLEGKRLETKKTDNMAAYDWLLRGQAFMHKVDPEATANALRCFEKAIELDPSYGRAYAFATWPYRRVVMERGLEAITPGERDRVMELSREALRIDRNDPFVIGYASINFSFFEGDHDEAMAMNDRALSMHPNTTRFWASRARLSCYMGDTATAIESGERAISINPNEPAMWVIYWSLAEAHLQLLDFERTVDYARQALRHNENLASSYYNIAGALAHLGNDRGAETALIVALKSNPGMTTEKFLRNYHVSRFRNLDVYLEGLQKAGLPD